MAGSGQGSTGSMNFGLDPSNIQGLCFQLHLCSKAVCKQGMLKVAPVDPPSKH